MRVKTLDSENADKLLALLFAALHTYICHCCIGFSKYVLTCVWCYTNTKCVVVVAFT